MSDNATAPKTTDEGVRFASNAPPPPPRHSLFVVTPRFTEDEVRRAIGLLMSEGYMMLASPSELEVRRAVMSLQRSIHKSAQWLPRPGERLPQWVRVQKAPKTPDGEFVRYLVVEEHLFVGPQWQCVHRDGRPVRS